MQGLKSSAAKFLGKMQLDLHCTLPSFFTLWRKSLSWNSAKLFEAQFHFLLSLLSFHLCLFHVQVWSSAARMNVCEWAAKMQKIYHLVNLFCQLFPPAFCGGDLLKGRKTEGGGVMTCLDGRAALANADTDLSRLWSFEKVLESPQAAKQLQLESQCGTAVNLFTSALSNCAPNWVAAAKNVSFWRPDMSADIFLPTLWRHSDVYLTHSDKAGCHTNSSCCFIQILHLLGNIKASTYFNLIR